MDLSWFEIDNLPVKQIIFKNSIMKYLLVILKIFIVTMTSSKKC